MGVVIQNLGSDRQQAVLKMIGEGKNTKEIAENIGISAKTVEHHRALLFKRLGLKSQPQAAAYAVANGLVEYGKDGLKVEPLAQADCKDIDDMERMTREMVSRAAAGSAHPQQVSCFVALVGTWIHVKRLKMDARFKRTD